MALIYEEIIPTPIINAKVEKIFCDSVHSGYRIEANKGFLLHDARNDNPVFDENNNETGEKIQFFRSGYTTVKYDYNFNDVVDGVYEYSNKEGRIFTTPVSMIGEFEFYSIPINIVPKKQTY